MKKTIAAFALATLACSAFAQTGANAQQQQRQSADAAAVNGGLVGSNNFTIEASEIPTSTTSRQIVEYEGSQRIKNTPSVGGPQLTTSNDTCMGSTSGSVNAPGVGIGFGTTWVDENCKRLKSSRELWNKGMKAASIAVDCEDATMRKALEMTGTVCPQSMTAEQRKAAFGPNASAEGAVAAPVVAQATPTAAPAVIVASAGQTLYVGPNYTGTDEFKAKRLNGNLATK